jgi:trigger factor
VNVQVERTEPCKAKIRFNVPAEEFEGEVRRMLTDLGRRSNMKGFRPGRVPPAVVERLHGKEVRREARVAFVQKAYDQAVGENDLRPFSHPRIDLGEQEPLTGADFQHEFEVTLRPEFELGEYKGLEVESALTPVSDEEVEAAIEQVRRNQAHPEPAGEEGLPEDGMALCKVDLLHADEIVFSREGLRLGPQTAVPGVDPQAFSQALVGAVDGAVVEVPLVFPDDFEREDVRGQEGVCRIVVQQAFRIVLPSREELLKLLDLEDDAALLAKVREKLEEANREQEDRRIEGELIERVIDAHDFELPAGMVEEQTKARLQQARRELEQSGLEGEQLEQQVTAQEGPSQAAAVKSGKAYFLVERIAEVEKLLVDEAELRSELQAIAQRNKAAFDEVASYYREQKLFPQLAMEIMERKVRAFLRENAAVRAPQA